MFYTQYTFVKYYWHGIVILHFIFWLNNLSFNYICILLKVSHVNCSSVDYYHDCFQKQLELGDPKSSGVLKIQWILIQILFFLDKITKIIYFALKNTMKQVLDFRVAGKSEIKLLFLN